MAGPVGTQSYAIAFQDLSNVNNGDFCDINKAIASHGLPHYTA